MLRVTLQSDDGEVVRLRAEGQISQSLQGEANPVEELLGRPGFARRVLLDLGPTDYIDSSGISWLIINHKQFEQAGGLLVLHSLPPRVSHVLSFCCMEGVFHLARDEADARALARGAGKGA